MDADEPPILLPCAVCGRTFSPDSLKRHTEICTKNHSKKRKPFDSAKQRLYGTELAEFQPKQETRRHQDEKSDATSWKKKHDDLLRTIREARGEVVDSRKQNDSLILSGAPTRTNEKGTCPTCNRHFGIKAYDRHVAWCKDRVTRVSVNPATNLAKERLEARIRYRAPTLKNRRAVTREKYSPGSRTSQSAKTSSSAPALIKSKETNSTINSNRETPVKQKPAIVRRSRQQKESSISPRPMKSRLTDRTNRPTEDHDSSSVSTSSRLSYFAISSRRPLHSPVSPIRLKNNDAVSSNENALPSCRKPYGRNETIPHCAQDETRNREAFARTQRNIVSARSQGHPKLNDIAVNDDSLGVTIQPCTIYKDAQYTQKDNQLMTWKQISHKKDNLFSDDRIVDCNPSQEFYEFDRMEDINVTESTSRTEVSSMTKDDFVPSGTEKDSLTTKKNLIRLNDGINKIDKDDDDISWLDGIQNLNRTCLIKDSGDIEQPETFHIKWKPIKHSPRVEFYWKDSRENVICESDGKKSEKGTVTNNEEISEHEVKELKISNESKKNDEIKIHVIEELIMEDKQVRRNDKQTSDEEVVEMTERKAERLNDMKSENEKEDGKTNGEEIEIAENDTSDVREMGVNTEDANSQIIDDEDTAKSEKLNANNKRDQLITLYKGIADAVDDIEAKEMKQNLSDSDQCIEISNVLSTQDISKEFEKKEESCSKQLKTDFSDHHLISDKSSETLAPQNSVVVADNHLNEDTNNKLLQVEADRQYEEKFFDDSVKLDDIGDDNTKNEKMNSDNCLDDKTTPLDRSIAKALEVTADESLLASSVNINSDFANDDVAYIERYDTRDADDSRSSIMSKNEWPREQVSPDTIINPNRVYDLTKRIIKQEHQVNPSESKMKHKIKKNMNLLRGSTDSLISSVEFVELASLKRPEASSTYERETIEIIRPSKRNRVFRHFPDIRNEFAETRENSEASYWEKATSISRDRLIGLDPSCHETYRLTIPNPKVRILPPVPNPPLMNCRKIELTTHPAWCSYMRRRPDFNLVLKARTGTYENYDPFLLAEQQLKDLLSDTSDQCMTRSSPEFRQTRDTLYPLTHSSAFVKYPTSGRRASLIAPPSEFDDLVSDFSSDSTETNSITREVFSKPDILANNGDATESTSVKPARALGRRLIINKSKALGVDHSINSADRPQGRIHDNVTSKRTKSSIDQINSIAPRSVSSSNRKTSDVREAHGSRIIEGQRSSDQRLNQRNNSSLSGSNLSLSSIISSSEADVKRSNSMFDELMASFEEDVFPDLKSFRNNESFDLSSPGGDRQRNGSLVSDEELSSPDSYKPQDHSKLSNDSAYSSLNRKYSHHGRSTNDMAGRFDEDVARNEISPIQTTKCKMSKFCHECGQRFPEIAKFCVECGVKRLAL